MGIFGKSKKDVMEGSYRLGLEHGLLDGILSNLQDPTDEERAEAEAEAESRAAERAREVFSTANEAIEVADRLSAQAEETDSRDDHAAAARAYRLASEKHEREGKSDKGSGKLSSLAAYHWRLAARGWDGDTQDSLLGAATDAEDRAAELTRTRS